MDATSEKEVEKPPQFFHDDSERSEWSYSGEINIQQRDGSHRINTEVRNLYVGREGRDLTYGLRLIMWQRNRLYPARPT